MQIKGLIKKTTYRNPENGFSVLKITLSENQKNAIVTGAFPTLENGEILEFEGEWGRHPKFGEQFKCITFKVVESQQNNIIDFLAGGNFPGIGPKTAKRIVDIFGDDTANILDNHPDVFRKEKIKGLPLRKMDSFIACWQESRHSRETLFFLYQHGIAGNIAKNLWNTYGQDTIDKIKENPYMLCEEIYGIGFLKADEIAMKIGFAKDSPIRMQAVILYTLQEASFSEGHVFLPKNILFEKAFRILRIPPEDDDLFNCILNQFDLLCKQERIKCINDDCFYPPLFKAEQNIADNINARLQQNKLPTEGFEHDLIDWEREHKFAFDPIQRKAIQMALAYKISIITGGPGTGKTTILKGILHLARKMSESIFLAAPTGRAAKRMSSLCGEQARTLHRLLEVDPITKKFNKNISNQLDCDLLIVDEFSMVDTWLAASLLEATPLKTRIVIVGDADQLPSVGPGNVLNDLIKNPQIPTTRLQHIFRQSGENDIADKAAKINQGFLPSPIEGPYFHFISYESPEEAKDIIQHLLYTGIREKINVDFKTELQLLSPMRKGPLGIFELNSFLQKILNPNVIRTKINGTEWSVGDRVMQIKNNYEKNVFNGDVGIIFSIAKASQKITVFFDDKTVDYEKEEIEQISLAYACTIHKSQGSEFPAVIVVLDNSHYMMLQRNLIYTAITRAKGHVWVLSAPGAFATAVRNNRSTKRFTRLYERLIID